MDNEAAALDYYVDELHRGPAVRPTGGGGELFALARLLKALFLPVEPSPLFRRALHAHLVAAAREGLPVAQPSWPSQHKRELLVGAAVGSAVSLVGLVALVVRLRSLAKHAA